jgi:hypothetical protein
MKGVGAHGGKIFSAVQRNRSAVQPIGRQGFRDVDEVFGSPHQNVSQRSWITKKERIHEVGETALEILSTVGSSDFKRLNKRLNCKGRRKIARGLPSTLLNEVNGL